MDKIFRKCQTIYSKYVVFFFTAVLFLWVKTYIVQLTQFNLGLENSLQEFLLILNPLGSAITFLGLAWLFKGRRKYIWLIVIDFLLSFLLYANVLYYRFFNDFITLPTIFQTQNFGDVSSSISSLLRPYDVLFFLDIVILIGMLVFKFVKIDVASVKRRSIVVIILLGIGISGVNLALAEIDRPQLLTRGFDRNYIVKYLGMYNYTIYDAVQTTRASTQRALADSDDTIEVINYTNSIHAEPNPEYFGAGKDMNVILLHLESIQEFLIDYKLHGEEVTPFLNSLTREENMIYLQI